MPFMEKVLETLKPGGTLQLATNERFYATAHANTSRASGR